MAGVLRAGQRRSDERAGPGGQQQAAQAPRHPNPTQA
jgi:hypothetical protein